MFLNWMFVHDTWWATPGVWFASCLLLQFMMIMQETSEFTLLLIAKCAKITEDATCDH